jgi:hypothetical protein
MEAEHTMMWKRSGMLTGQVWQMWSNHRLTHVNKWEKVMVPCGPVIGYHVTPLHLFLL